MHPDIEYGLRQVARETGRPFRVVEEVFQISMEVAEHGGVLTVLDGRVCFVSEGGKTLPNTLANEIHEIYDDVLHLIEHIQRANRRFLTGVSE
jgi:hypothetical protein